MSLLKSSTENAVTGQNDAIVYTQVEKLSDEEIKAYQADEFTLETIPIHPPPKEACRWEKKEKRKS